MSLTHPAASLKGKTLFITGASRGIGKAIGLRAARDGANIVIVAKTVERHPKLSGTIHTAVAEMEAAGGKALACAVDIRFEEQIWEAVANAARTFGGIDVLVNNASAISLTGTLATPMKRFDLMVGVNVRGTLLCSQACLPHLLQSAAVGRNPHILTLSPPLNLEPRWFKDHVAYSIAKYGMSLAVLGMAAEFKDDGIGINALWPYTLIATSALAVIPGMEQRLANCRKPEILADAAHAILVRDPREANGNFYLDEDVLREAGVTDFTKYAVHPGAALLPDLFVG